MEIGAAQADLRASYVRGGPGAIVSGVVWLIAAITASVSGIERGFVTLFFGGILIAPIGMLIVRTIFRRGAPAPGNPGGLTVIETVFPMSGGFLAAWLILPYQPDFVFPLCAIAVGAHYLWVPQRLWRQGLLVHCICAVRSGHRVHLREVLRTRRHCRTRSPQWN